MIEPRTLLRAAAPLAALTGPAGATTDSALAERLFRGFATGTPDAATHTAREALRQRGTPAEKTAASWRYTSPSTDRGLSPGGRSPAVLRWTPRFCSHL